jgi:ADP-ribose pyrophosphatase
VSDTPGGPEQASGAPYTVTRSERPFSGKIVTVRVDDVRAPDGRTSKREVAEHPGAVAALVVDQQGRIVLVEQWRQATGRRMLEIPAGKYDVDGEEVEAALRRELEEEIGVEGGELTWLTTFATSAGWSDEVVDLYLLEGATPLERGRPEGDWEEATMEIVALPYDEAVARLTGELGDSKTLIALGLYGLLRAGRWAPDQRLAPAPDAPASRAAARSSGAS